MNDPAIRKAALKELNSLALDGRDNPQSFQTIVRKILGFYPAPCPNDLMEIEKNYNEALEAAEAVERAYRVQGKAAGLRAEAALEELKERL